MSEQPKCTLRDAELLSDVEEWVSKLCDTGGMAWTLSVPVNFNRDPDILITELCQRYAALLARVARLEEALVSIRDYDSYKHPDEAIIMLREDEIKKAESCTACQHAKKSNWPPSGLCSEHYSSVTKAHDRVTQMFAYKQTWEPREIARRALEEK